MLHQDAPPVHICHQFSDWRHIAHRIKQNAGKVVAGLSLGSTALQTLYFPPADSKKFPTLWAMTSPAAAQNPAPSHHVWWLDISMQDECDPSGDSRQLLFSCFGVYGTEAEH